MEKNFRLQEKFNEIIYESLEICFDHETQEQIYDEIIRRFTFADIQKVIEIMVSQKMYDEAIKKNLNHFRDTAVGLWAFDCDPKDLIDKFNGSQSEACRLECSDYERLVEDWKKYCEDKNYFKSPFFRIEK